MSISKFPSTITLPTRKKPYPLIIDFLSKRFPKIEKKIWEDRINEGKILDEDEKPISFSTIYSPGKKLFYFREISDEPKIPYKEKLIFENEHFLIVDKPHFLPVIPSGPYVNECLLNRLKITTGNPDLSPVNRIDRETAGLVMISKNKKTRGLYGSLFEQRNVQKIYQAMSEYTTPPDFTDFTIKNRITKGTPWFRMKIEDGDINAITKIRLIKKNDRYVHFCLEPITGKKHQLRVHLSTMGFKIVNDRYYPHLLEKKKDDYEKPLQLLSQKLVFTDPLTGKENSFSSHLTLKENW